MTQGPILSDGPLSLVDDTWLLKKKLYDLLIYQVYAQIWSHKALLYLDQLIILVVN
jgi:hypothetical protein